MKRQIEKLKIRFGQMISHCCYYFSFVISQWLDKFFHFSFIPPPPLNLQQVSKLHKYKFYIFLSNSKYIFVIGKNKFILSCLSIQIGWRDEFIRQLNKKIVRQIL